MNKASGVASDLRRAGVALVRLVGFDDCGLFGLGDHGDTFLSLFRIRWRRTGRKGTAAKRPDPGSGHMSLSLWAMYVYGRRYQSASCKHI